MRPTFKLVRLLAVVAALTATAMLAATVFGVTRSDVTDLWFRVVHGETPVDCSLRHIQDDAQALKDEVPASLDVCAEQRRQRDAAFAKADCLEKDLAGDAKSLRELQAAFDLASANNLVMFRFGDRQLLTASREDTLLALTAEYRAAEEALKQYRAQLPELDRVSNEMTVTVAEAQAAIPLCELQVTQLRSEGALAKLKEQTGRIARDAAELRGRLETLRSNLHLLKQAPIRTLGDLRAASAAESARDQLRDELRRITSAR